MSIEWLLAVIGIAVGILGVIGTAVFAVVQIRNNTQEL